VGRFLATTCGKIFSILIVQDTLNLAGQMEAANSVVGIMLALELEGSWTGERGRLNIVKYFAN
jgi:hypothetical protein